MKTKSKTLDIILNIVLTIGIVLCVFLIVFKLCFVKVVVNGNSMQPSIDNGSKGYMIKVNKNSKIERFDVVASEYNSQDDYYIIKRVLGLPFEEVELVNNKLYINGTEVKQEFNFNTSTTNFGTTKWTLKEDEYLLVGDNRKVTIAPVVEHISAIIAKNGFSYATYDIDSSECDNSDNYSGCPIEYRKWYWFKDGK